MKILKTIAFIAVVAFVAQGTVLAANSDESQTRNVKSFKAIKVSTGIDLYLKMGDNQSVKVVAEDDIIDNLITEVKDETLHIYMKKRNNWFKWGGNQTKKVYVKVEELNLLHASSGSDVRTENTLKGESLDVSASSGSDVYLDVFYKNLSVDTSSGSDAKLAGKVKNLDVEASSGSDIKASDLESQNCSARASSGSDITIHVTEELNADASSGADIRYYGNPTTKDIDESSGGDVHGR